MSNVIRFEAINIMNDPSMSDDLKLYKVFEMFEESLKCDYSQLHTALSAWKDAHLKELTNTNSITRCYVGLKFKYLSFTNIQKEYAGMSVCIDGKWRATGTVGEVLEKLSSGEDKDDIPNYEIESTNPYFDIFVIRLKSR